MLVAVIADRAHAGAYRVAARRMAESSRNRWTCGDSNARRAHDC